MMEFAIGGQHVVDWCMVVQESHNEGLGYHYHGFVKVHGRHIVMQDAIRQLLFDLPVFLHVVDIWFLLYLLKEDEDPAFEGGFDKDQMFRWFNTERANMADRTRQSRDIQNTSNLGGTDAGRRVLAEAEATGDTIAFAREAMKQRPMVTDRAMQLILDHGNDAKKMIREQMPQFYLQRRNLIHSTIQDVVQEREADEANSKREHWEPIDLQSVQSEQDLRIAKYLNFCMEYRHAGPGGRSLLDKKCHLLLHGETNLGKTRLINVLRKVCNVYTIYGKKDAKQDLYNPNVKYDFIVFDEAMDSVYPLGYMKNILDGQTYFDAKYMQACKLEPGTPMIFIQNKHWDTMYRLEEAGERRSFFERFFIVEVTKPILLLSHLWDDALVKLDNFDNDKETFVGTKRTVSVLDAADTVRAPKRRRLEHFFAGPPVGTAENPIVIDDPSEIKQEPREEVQTTVADATGDIPTQALLTASQVSALGNEPLSYHLSYPFNEITWKDYFNM